MSAALHTMRESALRSWRKTLRRPVPLSFSFVQPLLWMLIFGFLFQKFALGTGYSRVAYLDFLLPGICCMTVLFGASQSGINLVRDLQTGFVQRMVRASTHPGFMLAGMIGADVVRLLAQALVVALIGIAIGARLSIDPLRLAGALCALALFAYAYASLSCWIALMTKAQESMAVFVHVMNMPLLFTSTALVPSRQMPEWLGEIARWNPLSLVADALRSAVLPMDGHTLVQMLARNALGITPLVEAVWLLVPLALLAVICFVMARYAMWRAALE